MVTEPAFVWDISTEQYDELKADFKEQTLPSSTITCLLINFRCVENTTNNHPRPGLGRPKIAMNPVFWCLFSIASFFNMI